MSQKVRDCIRDSQAWGALKPEEFAGGVEFEKDVSPIRCQEYFELQRQLVELPVVKHAEACTSKTYEAKPLLRQ